MRLGIMICCEFAIDFISQRGSLAEESPLSDFLMSTMQYGGGSSTMGWLGAFLRAAKDHCRRSASVRRQPVPLQ